MIRIQVPARPYDSLVKSHTTDPRQPGSVLESRLKESSKSIVTSTARQRLFDGERATAFSRQAFGGFTRACRPPTLAGGRITGLLAKYDSGLPRH